MSAGDVTKLPKWAQREIERLERNLEGLLEANRAIGTDDETNVQLSGVAFGEDLVSVPSGTRVLFHLDGGTLVAHHEHGRLTIRAEYRQHRKRFDLRPVVSNSISLGFGEDA